jgi:hypothetical protein
VVENQGNQPSTCTVHEWVVTQVINHLTQLAYRIATLPGWILYCTVIAWKHPLHKLLLEELYRVYWKLFLEFLELLIPHLPNVNVTDRAGRTSLQHAVYNGHVEVQYDV